MLDFESGRCYNCDSRYCFVECNADDPNYVYVTGRGWVLKTEDLTPMPTMLELVLAGRS